MADETTPTVAETPAETPAAPAPVTPAAAAPVTGQTPAAPAPTTPAPESEAAPSFLAGETDTPETAPAVPEVAEEIKITLPEGTKINEKLLSAFTDFAKTEKLGNETANKLANLYAGLIKDEDAQIEQVIQKQNQTWAKALEADPEFGGAQLGESKQALARWMKEYGSPELRADLKKFGLDNLPSLVKAIRKSGLGLREDNSGGGKPNGGSKSTSQQLHEWFPLSTNPDGTVKGAV